MYEEKIIAFVDILGFKNEIENKTIKKKIEIESETKRIYEFISCIRKDFIDKMDFLGPNNIKEEIYQSAEVLQFSDSLVFSYPAKNDEYIYWSIYSLLYLHMDAVNYGLLIRGGFTSGKLVHDKDHLFGPAMNDAYQMESKQAIFPRIIVNKKLAEKALGFLDKPIKDTNKEFFIDFLKKDFDGNYYLDYITFSFEYLLHSPGLHGKKYFTNLRKIINNNDQIKDDLSIIQKTNWLKNKYNLAIEKYKIPVSNKYCSEPEILKCLNKFELIL